MEQKDRKLDGWEELVEKTINAQAKEGLLPTSLIRDMDQRALYNNRPIHITAKVQT